MQLSFVAPRCHVTLRQCVILLGRTECVAPDQCESVHLQMAAVSVAECEICHDFGFNYS